MVTKKDISKLESLLFLLAVSQNTSKRKVSEELCTSVDTLNKYLNDLEQELGIKLLASNGRGSVITPEAQEIVKLAEQLGRTISALDSFANKKIEVSGTVRLGITEGINTCILPEKIIDFYELYPNLNIEVLICDSNPNLNIFEADVALTYYVPQGSDLVIICSKPIRCGLFVSPNYIERFGMPKNMEDMLENHRLCIKTAHKSYVPGWKELIKKAQRISITTNSTHSLLAQINHGGGIGLIPIHSALDNFVRISTFEYEPIINFYLVVHKDSKDSPKIRVLIDYILSLMKCF